MAPESEVTAPVVGPESGLSVAQAAQRLAEDGPNALPGGQRRSLLSIAAETVREPMFLLLLAAGTLYLVFGDLQEGLTLFGFVVVTVALTLYQEGKTERAIEALRDLTSPRALVIRDGQPQRIAGRDVVRGDLLKLSEGDRVPADALLVSADGVRADESLLTGEAVPVGKRVARPDELTAAAKPADTAPRCARRRRTAGRLRRHPDRAGARAGPGDGHRRAQRDRPHRHRAGHGGATSVRRCRSRPPGWCATWPCWRWR